MKYQRHIVCERFVRRTRKKTSVDSPWLIFGSNLKKSIFLQNCHFKKDLCYNDDLYRANFQYQLNLIFYICIFRTDKNNVYKKITTLSVT